MKLYHTHTWQKTVECISLRKMSNNKGITDDLRGMKVGDQITLYDIERPNIHALATRALRQVKVNRIKNSSCFNVTCIAVLPDKGEVDDVERDEWLKNTDGLCN